MKPRSRDLSNPSQDTKWLRAEVATRQWGQASVRHSFPQGPGFLSQSRILPDIWLKHFADFWDLLMRFFASKKQNLKLLFSLRSGNANQPTQTASQTVLPPGSLVLFFSFFLFALSQVALSPGENYPAKGRGQTQTQQNFRSYSPYKDF